MSKAHILHVTAFKYSLHKFSGKNTTLNIIYVHVTRLCSIQGTGGNWTSVLKKTCQRVFWIWVRFTSHCWEICNKINFI